MLDEFVADAVRADDVAVSLEDDRAVCTCTTHDGVDTISAEAVCDLVDEHELFVAAITADMDAGTLTVEVTS
jgi:hypothetical protein